MSLEIKDTLLKCCVDINLAIPHSEDTNLILTTFVKEISSITMTYLSTSKALDDVHSELIFTDSQELILDYLLIIVQNMKLAGIYDKISGILSEHYLNKESYEMESLATRLTFYTGPEIYNSPHVVAILALRMVSLGVLKTFGGTHGDK